MTNEIIVEVWPEGYATQAGLSLFKMPAESTDAEIKAEVRRRFRYGELACIRRPLVTSEVISEEYARVMSRNDNS